MSKTVNQCISVAKKSIEIETEETVQDNMDMVVKDVNTDVMPRLDDLKNVEKKKEIRKIPADTVPRKKKDRKNFYTIFEVQLSDLNV